MKYVYLSKPAIAAKLGQSTPLQRAVTTKHVAGNNQRPKDRTQKVMDEFRIAPTPKYAHEFVILMTTGAGLP